MPDASSPLTHLAPVLRGMGTSATVAINDRSHALIEQGSTIYKLGLGQSPFPVPAHVAEALRRHAAEKDYLPTAGLRPLRDAVAAHAERTLDISFRGEQAVIGPGSKELMFLLQLAYGGELLLPNPSWVSYAPQANLVGRPVTFLNPSNDDPWRLDHESLERHCAAGGVQPRLLILNSPSNPTGLSLDDGRLRAIAEVARKHQVLVLSDEIYGELHHEGDHHSIARHYPEGTIVSGGLSKWCGAGGWRLGTFLFPPGLTSLRDAVIAAGSETYTSVSAPIQYAAIEAYRPSAEMDDYLNRSRRVVRALGRWCAHLLNETGATCPIPEGGFYLFPSFEPLREMLEARGITEGMSFASAALDATGVAFLPGSCFGRPTEELTARLAYVDFDGARALEAAAEPELSDAWLREYCNPVVVGMERLADWIRG